MAEDMGEKTEAPTGRKRSDARSAGNIAKSQDLTAAIELITAALLIVLFGGAMVKAITGVMRHILERPGESLSGQELSALLSSLAMTTAIAVAPVLGLLFILGVGANILQVGLVFTTQPLVPKFSKLNPFTGFGRLFDSKNAVKTGVSLVKLVVVVAVSYAYLKGCMYKVAGLPLLGAMQGIGLVGKMATELVAWLLALLLTLGAADWAYQKWQHTQDLRMTKDEVKDERRSMEGDPAIKGRRFRLMREMALQRVNQAVPKADVIVTNPTHYSVAIQYDAKTMRAPRVVAKGVDHMAMRIRQVAMVHHVPIVERPPLARGLYAAVEVGHEVKPEFYQAIAELLAYVYRLEREAA